jgi:hypothetical protein
MKISIKTTLLLSISVLLFSQELKAQESTENAAPDSVKLVRKKLYWSSGLDMFLFSTARAYSAASKTTDLSPLRFTYFLNFGFNLNYDISKNIGVFTGIGMKNLGYIEKYATNDSTVKRRVLALGIPVGIKFGNLHRHTYGFAGIGVDAPFNYKEKGYIKRGNKDKFNEWFSDRTPRLMHYWFAGFAFKPGLTLKGQYYPSNFINGNYKETVTTGTTTTVVRPYSSIGTTSMYVLSVGFDIRYTKKSKKVPVSTTPAMQTM